MAEADTTGSAADAASRQTRVETAETIGLAVLAAATGIPFAGGSCPALGVAPRVSEGSWELPRSWQSALVCWLGEQAVGERL